MLKPDIYDRALNPVYRDMLSHYGVGYCHAESRRERSRGPSDMSRVRLLKGKRFESLDEAQAYLDYGKSAVGDTHRVRSAVYVVGAASAADMEIDESRRDVPPSITVAAPGRLLVTSTIEPFSQTTYVSGTVFSGSIAELHPILQLRQNFWPLCEFADLHDVNRQARQWLAEVANRREHRETRQRPMDRFQPATLRPLPVIPYDYRDSVEALVHKDLRVQFDANRYCVPTNTRLRVHVLT